MSADDDARRWLPIAAAGAAACALFALSVGGGFVYDDHRFLADNGALTEPSVLWRAFSDPAVQTSDGSHAGLWRPLRTLSFALDAWLFGGAPSGSHAVNVLLHGAATSAVAALLLRWRAGIVGALLGALLYAAHPVQVECVAWISSRGDLLAALALWSSLLLAARDRRTSALVTGALALLAKEQAVVWPLLACASAVLCGRAPKDAIRRAVAPALVTVAFVSVRYALLEEPLQQGGLGAPAAAEIWRMLGHQVGFALVPVGALFDWQMPELARPLGRIALAVLGALPFVALLRRSTRPLGLWFLAALVPTLFVQVLVPLNIRVADRFLLFCLPALAAGGALAVRRDGRVAPALGLGVACCAVLTLTAIPIWKSDATLWTRTAAGVPGHWRAEQNLGVQAFRAGAYEDAVAHFRAAVEAGPRDAHTRYQLAWALERHGSETREPALFREALREYLAANALVGFPRTRHPERVQPLARLGAAYLLLALGEADDARAATELLLLDPAPPSGARDGFWEARVAEFARRVEVHLDEDLARRVREWASTP